MNIQPDRVQSIQILKQEAHIGGTDNGRIHRLTLSDTGKEVRDCFLNAMEDAGLEAHIDRMGNLLGRRAGTDQSGDPVPLGSCLDSQPYSGIYDGTLGTVAALGLVRTLNDENIKTSYPIEIVNWTNEEGSRVQLAMLGSGVWKRELNLETEYNKTDAEGNRYAMEVFSGAVHNAVKLRWVCDTAMLFTINEDSKSHTEEEYDLCDDCYSAANTFGQCRPQLSGVV